MSKKYDKLNALLKELFQLDQPDLDFGLYRIMHAKAAEVTQFLDRDLLPQVKAEFAKYKTADKSEIEKELAKAIEAAQGLGVDPETTQKVKDLRAKLTEDAVDIAGLEAEVYDHLFGFFRRYYSEGDYLSKRVYKPGVYAIPYEGEEVTLHWANADQYYIKTSEYLRDYVFRLKPDDDANPMRVHFCLVDVAEGEHGNVKPANGKERVFILAAQDCVAVEGGELFVRFEYRPATLTDWPDDAREGKAKPPAQKEMTGSAETRILGLTDAALAPWVAELRKAHVKVDGEQADYTRLRAHLNRYVARNTFDYFIHKDLGGFLRRELDFYIKNEVMHLDDVENETAPRVEQYLSKIKVIRRIAGKIIEFLAQLEDFQKKLWLKKKFVVETQWCVALKEVPAEFHAEVAANVGQLAEWKTLYGIEPSSVKAKGDAGLFGDNSELITLAPHLQVPPSLMIDTRHFDAGFTARLLDTLGDVDERTDGVLFHGENVQALSIAQARYREKVKCIYIDPPYNTGDGDFPYKDSYQSSSWLSMMNHRLSCAYAALSHDGVLISHIDEHEFHSLEWLASMIFGPQSNIGPVIWDKRNPKGDARGIASQHEYLCWFAKDAGVLTNDDNRLQRAKENAQKMLDRASDFIQQYKGVNEQSRSAFRDWLRDQPFSGGELAYSQIDDSGDVFRPVSMAWPNKTKAPEDYFRPLIHPRTKRPCPVPERGWRNPPATMDRLLNEGLILFGPDETTQPTRKYRLRENMFENVPSLYYFGGSDDDLQKNIGFFFPNPKPVRLGQYVCSITLRSGHAILDFFAGSGTTGHAVINLNREDGARRRFILVEMADYFDTVLLPRLKKVALTPEWKDGQPKRAATVEEIERGPRVLKVIRLESYEDALNNLVKPRRTQAQQTLLEAAEAQGADRLKEHYVLRYMLNVETEGSPSLLNVRSFTDPGAYRLKVKRPGSDESKEINVDLLETFNWLIALTVGHIAAPKRFAAEFERDAEKRLRLKGRLKQDDAGLWWFRTVTGTTPDGRKTLVIWRKRPGGEAPEGVEQDNLVLDEWFTRQGYSSKDSEFDLIYVNGTNNLENLRAPDDTWKVRLIEDDFHRLMFDSTE